MDQTVGGPKGCTGLSEHGRCQAAALRDRLAATGELGTVDVLLSSTLPRAVETAEILAPAVGGLAVEQLDDLCELRPGEADALLWDDYRSLYMGEGWTWDPYRPMAPGGESWAEFMVRVGRTLTDVSREHAGRTIVVACHGGVIEGSLVSLGHLPTGNRFDVDIENTSITEWQWRPNRRGHPAWALARFNDAAHLRTRGPASG